MTEPGPEQRYYRDAQGRLIDATVQERVPADQWTTAPEGRLYVEISIEAFEEILTLAGFTRDPRRKHA